jgi:hypothetical protein
MKLIRPCVYLCLAVITLSLSLAFWQVGYSILITPLIILFGLWGLAHWRGWSWASDLAFGVSSLVVGVGAWAGASPFWLFLSLAGMIIAWDLGRFARLLDRAGSVRDEGGLWKAHFIRLGGVLVIGLGLSFLAVNLSLGVNFDLTLILVFVLIYSLSRVVGYLRYGEH